LNQYNICSKFSYIAIRGINC